MKMFGATCDGCKEQWADGHNGYIALSQQGHLESQLQDSGWEIMPDKTCYCPDCHYIDSNDNLIIKSIIDPTPTNQTS